MKKQSQIPWDVPSCDLIADNIPEGWKLIPHAGYTMFPETWRKRLGENWDLLVGHHTFQIVLGVTIGARWMINGVAHVIMTDYYVLLKKI
jgi:hypothetical protein